MRPPKVLDSEPVHLHRLARAFLARTHIDIDEPIFLALLYSLLQAYSKVPLSYGLTQIFQITRLNFALERVRFMSVFCLFSVSATWFPLQMAKYQCHCDIMKPPN